MQDRQEHRRENTKAKNVQYQLISTLSSSCCHTPQLAETHLVGSRLNIGGGGITFCAERDVGNESSLPTRHLRHGA